MHPFYWIQLAFCLTVSAVIYKSLPKTYRASFLCSGREKRRQAAIKRRCETAAAAMSIRAWKSNVRPDLRKI